MLQEVVAKLAEAVAVAAASAAAEASVPEYSVSAHIC